MRVGDYEVVERIGQGGAGVVFKARREGALVAVKVLKDRSPQARARFEREARLLAAFGEADGFVPFLDHGECPEGPYLVMPFLEGGSLRDRLRGGPLGVEEALALARSLGGALAHAHEKGVVHRDVKPENVLRQRDRWLLADLGIAKHFDDGAEGASRSVSLSKTGSARGTIGYMAPEQLNDAKSAGPPADVFALGVLLYESLGGAMPFEGATVILIVQAVLEGKVVQLRERRPDVPAWLAATIHRALAADPEARPRDAAAFLDELERHVETGSRSRTLLAILGLLVVLAAAALAAALAPKKALAPPAPPPSPQARSVPRTLAQELHALLEASAAPTPEVVAAVASAWKDERIHADALALADLHPEPFVLALESRREPRVLLAHAWLAAGAVDRREEIRASIGSRRVLAAMNAADGLLAATLRGSLQGRDPSDAVVPLLKDVRPATRAALAVVLAPITAEALGRFDSGFDRAPWLVGLTEALGDACPFELVALATLDGNVSALDRLEPLAARFPPPSAIGAALRYRALQAKTVRATAPEVFRQLGAAAAAIHAETAESLSSLGGWLEACDRIELRAAKSRDWDDALAVARACVRTAPEGDVRRHAGRSLAVLELASDRARTEIEGADVDDPTGTSPIHAEILRRKGQLDAARRLLVALSEDSFALGVLVRVEGQRGDLAAAHRALDRLEKRRVPEELALLDDVGTLRAWLDALEAKPR